MQRFDSRSYAIGVLSGILILVMFIGVKALFTSPATPPPAVQTFDNQRGQFRSEGMQLPAGDMMNPERLQMVADRFSMTVEQLQAELDAGKTLPEIAEERGIEFTGGLRQPRQGTGATRDPALLPDETAHDSSPEESDTF